eukprot:TRINITY_DN7938_c0_g1_i1.p1 TRINITY_DN7938_c0_g1~~TRINITY_DN7938_c0_g1_i1.p1  ORF type:complete len:227 (-),score=9.31 TRINITY_DN7938_c0_g1_i1:25-705(-)
MSPITLRVEYSSTGRSECRHCHCGIEKGALFLGVKAYEDYAKPSRASYHLRCFRAAMPSYWIRDRLEKMCAEDIPGYSELKQRDQHDVQRVLQIKARSSDRAVHFFFVFHSGLIMSPILFSLDLVSYFLYRRPSSLILFVPLVIRCRYCFLMVLTPTAQLGKLTMRSCALAMCRCTTVLAALHWLLNAVPTAADTQSLQTNYVCIHLFPAKKNAVGLSNGGTPIHQ